MKSTNGHSSIRSIKDTSVSLKKTKSPHIYALHYQGKVLGHVDTNEVDDIRFIPTPKKKEFALIEMEKIAEALKKARQMKQHLMNTLERFIN